MTVFPEAKQMSLLAQTNQLTVQWMLEEHTIFVLSFR
jgi:hypothetical protein